MKACSQCFVVKPLALFYRREGRPDGRKTECVDCSKKYKASVKPRSALVSERALSLDYSSVNTDWEFTESEQMFIAKCRAGNPELIVDPTAEKWCGKCSQALHPTMFTKDVHKKDGLRRICRSCASERYKTKELEQ